MKRVIAVLFTAAALSIFFLCRTDGFFIYRIKGPLISGVNPSLPLERFEALEQPYRYLSKGRQCFVFVSADGRTVIKFLNYDRFTLPKFLKLLPLPHYWRFWLAALEDRRRLRFEATINSYELAMRRLRDETGLIYLHFQKGEGLPKLMVQDRAHRIHRIDLNRTAFIVQKRAKPIFEELESLWERQGLAGLNRGIESFLALLRRRCGLLIADDDRDVEINYGFCEDRLVLLDPGRLSEDRSLETRERVDREMRIASKRLRQWLSKNHPESIAFFDERVLPVYKGSFKNNL